MFVVEPIRFRHHFVVEALITRLVAADQQDGVAQRIEGKESSKRSALVLGPQFFHIGVTRSFDRVGVRPGQRRTELHQKLDARPEPLLLGLFEPVPPAAELVGVFHVPHR